MKKRILITSVGSLVGQNVLDSLHGRRENLLITGTNSIAEVANNFRCDKTYLVSPASETNKYIQELLEIIDRENPDLVIPGRDDDVTLLAQLGEDIPSLSDKFLVGSAVFAGVMDDKVKSYEFARRHGIPFAPTIESGATDTAEKAEKIVNDFGFPLIAKPSKGNGSKGIWVVLNQRQLDEVVREPGFSLQPLFGRSESFVLETKFGLPFFWEIPEHMLYASQVIINKNREISAIFGFISKMVIGRCERMDRCEDPELLDVVRRFAEAAVQEGWRGPFNVQLKKDKKYGYQVIELNGRFSGGTSGRYHFGFDEVADILRDWLGNDAIPRSPLPEGVNVVTKILTDFAIKDSDVKALENSKVWTAT